ncbi:MAG TPA: ABC transporter permease [Gaiellales bacterium]|nr:ABC transporter permease [Gaiellales bacterium]
MATSDRPVVSGVAPGAAEITTGPEEPAVIARGYWEQAWRRFKRDRVAMFGAFTIIFLILVAFIGLPIAEHLLGRSQYDINVNAQGYQPLGPFSSAPNATGTGTTFYVLGTSDTAGHDEFLGMLGGAQISLEVAIISTIIGLGVGIVLGMLAGFFGGAVDVIVSRATEIVMALPLLLFAIALSFTVGSRLNTYTFFGLFSPGVVTLVIVISAFSWYYPARIVRAQVLSLREKEFVEAARMVGASNMRILRSHLLPHLTGTIIVYATLTVAVNILFEAGLSYLGVGIPQGEPSWGNLINSAVGYYITVPWLMVWPGLGILIATLAFNLLGDGLRDALDPRGGR